MWQAGTVLMGKPELKVPLGRSRHRWEVIWNIIIKE
jgi:hypothetical protein